MNEENFLSINDAKSKVLYVSNKAEVIMNKGEGMYLWDCNGKKYLDFIAGWAVNCLGHSPKPIQEALTTQAAKLINASPNFYNIPMLKCAELLVENSCFDKVFFMSTGAEANECAIKLARKYGSKFLNGAYEIITTYNSFHGRTLATMAATGKKGWKNLFAPQIQGFKHVDFNSIDCIYNAVNKNTCAVMIELIQGEGGVNLAGYDYVRELSNFCSRKGILLIIDEIQTGIGRTGSMFAYEQYKIEPDIVTLAKGLGGGFPVSAIMTKKQYDIFEAGEQGGTYTGQPLAMAVVNAVLDEILGKKLYLNAKIQGNRIMEMLKNNKEQLGISDVRGKGLLIAFDLKDSNAVDVTNKCLDKGLIINAVRENTIRLIPALTVKNEEINLMYEILSDVLSK